MADVITRFKLETSQYDSKLRDTVKNLKEVLHMNELPERTSRSFRTRRSRQRVDWDRRPPEPPTPRIR
jgi:hypothetical protein